MITLYVRELLRRAFGDSVKIVISNSLSAWLVKCASIIVLLWLTYKFVLASPADDDATFYNRLLFVGLGVGATFIVTLGMFLIQVLFLSPFELWKEQKQRAEIAEQAIASSETPKQRDARLFQEQLAQERAQLRVKAQLMRDRLGTRRHSYGDPRSDTEATISYLAAMWDAEHRGEFWDEYHRSTFMPQHKGAPRVAGNTIAEVQRNVAEHMERRRRANRKDR